MSLDKNFNPNDRVQVMEFLNGLTTEESLLNNSSMIYCLEEQTKKPELENLIRYGNLTMEQLSLENTKLNSLISTAINSRVPMCESTQQYMVDMSKLVNSRILEKNNEIANTYNQIMIESLNTQMGYTDVDAPTMVTETLNPFDSEVLEYNLAVLDNNTTLTATELLEGLDMLVNPQSPLCINNDCDKNSPSYQFKSLLCDKFKRTFEFQKGKPEFSDFPILQCVSPVKMELNRRYSDKPHCISSITNLIDEFVESVDKSMEEFMLDFTQENGFAPNPFDVYNLTPFPVGSRTMDRTIGKIINAETDEQLTEAFTDLARIQEACNVFGEQILTEKTDNFIKKGTRAIARGSNKIARKAHSKGKDIEEVKDNLKRAVDPMEKFINDTFNKIKKADNEERRNLIIKGGIVPKISRWLKRGIVSGILWKSFGAWAAGLSLLTFIAVDKHSDKKARAQILRELETELKIIEEKIDDSRGDEDKSKKYELLRAKAKVEKDIERITLGLPA